MRERAIKFPGLRFLVEKGYQWGWNEPLSKNTDDHLHTVLDLTGNAPS